jgi:hypothetical protein
MAAPVAACNFPASWPASGSCAYVPPCFAFSSFSRLHHHAGFRRILITGALSTPVVVVHTLLPGLLQVFSDAPSALLGIALSIFLHFRNNACYDRWGEAHKRWGQLVYSARQILESGAGEAGADARRLLRLAIAFVQSLVPLLRKGGCRDKVERLLADDLAALPGKPDAAGRHCGTQKSRLGTANFHHLPINARKCAPHELPARRPDTGGRAQGAN